MLYTCRRASEGKHAHKSRFSDITKRKYILENNLVPGQAKNSDFPKAHESIFYGTRSNAEKIPLRSVFTRFWWILSATQADKKIEKRVKTVSIPAPCPATQADTNRRKRVFTLKIVI